MYIDNNGNEFESYEEACVHYGADTPADLAYEAEAEAREWEEHCLEHGLFVTVVPATDIPF